jgi:hypothetical protein
MMGIYFTNETKSLLLIEQGERSTLVRLIPAELMPERIKKVPDKHVF